MLGRIPSIAALALASALVAAAEPASLGARAREALADGRLDEASKLAKELANAEPADAEGYRIAGLAAFRGGRYEEARAAFLAQLARERSAETAPVVHFNLAGAEFKLGRFVEAEGDYRAAAADPGLAPLATLNAALAADRAGAHDSAGDLLRAAAVLGAGGSVGEQADRLLGEWRDARAADRRDGAYHLAHEARAELAAGRAADAVSLYYGARAEAAAGAMAAAERAEIDVALGNSLLAAGRPREAEAALRTAAAALPRDGEVRYLLGVALNDAGDPAAADAFRAALAAGLSPGDAARTRGYLDALDHPELGAAVASARARFTVEPMVGFGWDSHYAAGRETIFGTNANQSSAEIVADVEPRLRLFGRPSNGAWLGNRVDALLYLSGEADPFSLIEDDLYLEGAWSPLAWLTLRATGEGYLQSAGVSSFGLYETGAQLALKATAYEGERFATRVRYAHTFMQSLDPNYQYLSGGHDDASIAELAWLGRWRLSLGYVFRSDAVGVQTADAMAILPANLVGPDNDFFYRIPWSYTSHDVGFDADGDLAGFHLSGGLHYERRDYGGTITTTSTSAAVAAGMHTHRVDDRYAADLAVKRLLGFGIYARLSAYLLFSASTINNQDLAFKYDFDDKTYVRFVGTLELLRPF